MMLRLVVGGFYDFALTYFVELRPASERGKKDVIRCCFGCNVRNFFWIRVCFADVFVLNLTIYSMGIIHADIELINGGYLELVHQNLLDKDEVRHGWVNMLVDTGKYAMCINEGIREMLGLDIRERRTAELANGHIIACDVAGPIEVLFGNRGCTVDALVLPGGSEALLGAIPMGWLRFHFF